MQIRERKSMFIDSHCHYDRKQFNKNRFEILADIKLCGVGKIITPAIELESNVTMYEKLDITSLSREKLPEIYYTAGIHPTRTCRNGSIAEREWENVLRKAVKNDGVVAIGETGLDYHNQMDENMFEKQHFWFHKQLEIAKEFKLPLVLHIRQADIDAIEVLKQYPLKESGVVHCFNGDTAIAEKYIEMGLFFGIGGSVTLDESDNLRDAVKHIPLERIILETDAPYVHPKWCNDRLNTSLNIPKIADYIAELKNISAKEVERVTTENAENLFGI